MEENWEEKYETLKKQLEFDRELKRRFIHDIKSPVSVISGKGYYLEKELGELSELDSLAERRKLAFKMRGKLSSIANSARRISNQAEMLHLSGMDYDSLNKNRTAFFPFELLDEILGGYEHSMIVREEPIGVRSYFPEDLRELEVKANKGAFMHVVANLFDNAIQYAYPGSVINMKTGFNEGEFRFELENMVAHPIDSEELRNIFENEYRSNPDEENELNNEGIGLFYTQKTIVNGFRGTLKTRSEDSFQITDERTVGLSVKDYGFVPPRNYSQPLPSFYIDVRIPLDLARVETEVLFPESDEGFEVGD